MATIAALMAVVFASTAGNLPDFRENQKASAPGADEIRTREAAKAFALRRESAIAMVQTDDDYPAARRAIAAILGDPMFASLSPAEQRDVVSSAAWVEVRTGQYQAAAEYYRKAVALDPSDPDDWHRLSMAEDESGNYDAAADALRRVLTDWPHLTDALSGGHVEGLVDHLALQSESRLALMQTLFDANWKREEETSSDLWYEMAVTLLERGDREGARTVIARIGWPRPLMRLQADRRFDGLLPAEPDHVVQSLNRQIERLAVLSADNPRNLYTHNEWLDALLQAGRNDEVIAISAGIIDRIDGSAPERPAFHDSDDENFTLKRRSDALRRAGRMDEALAVLVRASTMPEYEEPNVSQKLSLAELYNGLLRPDDAMEAVRELGVTAGKYSTTRQALVRMQAALIKGDRRKAEQLLAHIRQQGDDTFGLQFRALLRSGRIDEAAALFIARLRDPRKRGETLLMAQDTLDLAPLPGDVAYRRDRDVLFARSDVRAAIDAVGRVNHYDVW
ncbi:MAG TPA: tetratricopeptide repeat protein [Lysobacter sp.]